MKNKNHNLADPMPAPNPANIPASIPAPISSLAEIREQIMSLDNQLITLLAKRRELSQSVVLTKISNQKPVRDITREQLLLNSLVTDASKLNLDPNYISRLFQIIIEDSVIYQQNYLQSLTNPEQTDQTEKRLAVLGGKGSYSYLAAKNYFANKNNVVLGFPSFEKVLKSVEDNVVDYAIIPIENTTSGCITEVFDLLLDANLNIIGETKYAIEHCLVASPGSHLKDIKTIYAHPEAARQCNKNLKQLVDIEVSLVSSSARALELVNENNGIETKNDSAAIASKEAAELFGLDILLSNIANRKDNCTRFFIVAKTPITVSLQVASKTSLAISTGQKSGSLAAVLNLFKNANIILTKLESRPIPEKPWQQLFYLDIEANIADKKLQQIFEEISLLCHFVKVLGCYPTQDIIATKVSASVLAKANYSNENKD